MAKKKKITAEKIREALVAIQEDTAKQIASKNKRHVEAAHKRVEKSCLLVMSAFEDLLGVPTKE